MNSCCWCASRDTCCDTRAPRVLVGVSTSEPVTSTAPTSTTSPAASTTIVRRFLPYQVLSRSRSRSLVRQTCSVGRCRCPRWATCSALATTARCRDPLRQPRGRTGGERRCFRVDPRLETQRVETMYHEFPLRRGGLPHVGYQPSLRGGDAAPVKRRRGRCKKDHKPEFDGPPDAQRFYPKDVDALHLTDPVTRGPTIERTTFGPFWTPSTQWLVDGSAQLVVGSDRWDIAETAIAGERRGLDAVVTR